MCAYFGWLKYADSKHFLYTIQCKTGIKWSNWNGKEIGISKFYNKYVRIINIMFYNKYYKICCVRNGILIILVGILIRRLMIMLQN